MQQRGAAPLAQALALGVLIVGLVGACYEEPVAITTWPPTELPSASAQPMPTGQPNPTSTTILLPTQGTATPGPSSTGAIGGAPSADCINGWTTPAADSAEYAEATAMLDSQMEVDGPWQITEMRSFTGPDVSWTDTPADVVERWYVRGALAADPDFRGRWLLERRGELIKGVVAVAPYDSAGFQSPDWTGFVGEGQPTTYLGLPGQWTGSPYDFVTGAGYSGEPGLPDQVVGCLSAT